MANTTKETKESKVDNTKTDDKSKTSAATATGNPTSQDRNDRPGTQATHQDDAERTTTTEGVVGDGTNRQFQRSEQAQADENQRPHMEGEGTKVNNPIMSEHPGQPIAQQVAGQQAQPEMRNEDRRSPPNRHIQVNRDADRPALAPVTGRSPEEQRRADRELEMKRDPHGVRTTLKSEVTGERIRTRDVGARGPDDLTGGIVTESRQTGALVTNEQRAGCMPESTRRENERLRSLDDADEEEERRKREEAEAGQPRTEVDRFADQRLHDHDDGPHR